MAELTHSDYRVRELVALVGEPQNLVSYHLRLLRDAELVTLRRSSFDGRDSYYHLDLDRCGQALGETGVALHPALRYEPAPAASRRRPPRVRVLFVCTGNSARSPIAEALLGHRGGGRVEVDSAGSRPKPDLHPHAVRVLRDEFGIDITGRRPRHLDACAGRRFDYVISLCDKAREARPDFSRLGHEPADPDVPVQPRRMHWSIADPSLAGDTDYAAFQRTAADIDNRIRYLLPVITAM